MKKYISKLSVFFAVLLAIVTTNVTVYAAEGFFEFDSSEYPLVKYLIISFVVAFIISLIVNASIKSKLISVRPNNTATEYVVKDSMNVTRNRDNYLYTKVNRTKIEQANPPAQR